MMSYAPAGFEHDQVESERQPRERTTVWQRTSVEEAVRRGADPNAFAVVDRLLGEAEASIRTPSDLDDDERRWRTRIDGDEIDLVPADAHVPGNDGPSGGDEVLGGQ